MSYVYEPKRSPEANLRALIDAQNEAGITAAEGSGTQDTEDLLVKAITNASVTAEQAIVGNDGFIVEGTGNSGLDKLAQFRSGEDTKTAIYHNGAIVRGNYYESEIPAGPDDTVLLAAFFDTEAGDPSGAEVFLDVNDTSTGENNGAYLGASLGSYSTITVTNMDGEGGQTSVDMRSSISYPRVRIANDTGPNGGNLLLHSSTGHLDMYQQGPDCQMDMYGGDLKLSAADFVLDTIGKGVVIQSPDGTKYRIKVANGGALSTEVVA